MGYIDDAFDKLKSNLEISDVESELAQSRHQLIREHIEASWTLVDHFLTGSYARHTKTKKLKDVDIFAVIDPGVGSRRRAIAVQTVNYFFVGPDNGVLSLALAREKIKAIHQITNERLFVGPVSNTFHGRDVFAPVAASLSKGLPLGKVGAPMKEFVKLSWPEPQRATNSIKGEIAYIDRFGNAITNIGNAALASLAEGCCEMIVKGKRLCALQPF